MSTQEEHNEEELYAKYLKRSNLPGYLNLSELFSTPPHEETWYVPGLIAKGRHTQMHGPAKSGKSLVTLAMAAAIATGSDFAGMPTVKAKVLYLDYENNPKSDIEARLVAMGYTASQLEKNLIILSMPELPTFDTDLGGMNLAAMADAQNINLVIIDTVSRTISGEENSNDTWSRFYNYTGKRLKQLGIAMHRIDHTGKDQSKGARGGSSKSTDVDIVCLLTASKKIINIEVIDGRIKTPFTKLRLSLEESPVLHFQTIDPPQVVTIHMRVNDICDALDAAGVQRGLGNIETREEMEKLDLRAAKAISEEVTRRRKDSIETSGPEECPPHVWGWNPISPSPKPQLGVLGYSHFPRRKPSRQGFHHPRKATGRS